MEFLNEEEERSQFVVLFIYFELRIKVCLRPDPFIKLIQLQDFVRPMLQSDSKRSVPRGIVEICIAALLEEEDRQVVEVVLSGVMEGGFLLMVLLPRVDSSFEQFLGYLQIEFLWALSSLDGKNVKQILVILIAFANYFIILHLLQECSN